MSRPLRFLHLTTFYPPYSFGGDGIFVRRLAHALADAGHEVDVVHCLDAYHLLHPGPPEVDAPAHPGVKRHALRSGLGPLSPLISHQSGLPGLKRRALEQILAERTFDVVHFHNISLFGPGVLTLEAGRALKLYTAHEHWLVCPTHVLWKFNRRPCERPQCLRCTLLARRPPQLWRYSSMIERAAEEVDQFLAPSHFTAELHRERGFRRPMTRLPNFAERRDLDWQNPTPRPHPRPYFLFVGRLERLKGLDDLLSAWERCPGPDLLIAGHGSEANRIRRVAAANPRVHLLGPLSQERLGPLYLHALACVVPSLTFEVFGTVVLEAFSRKTPVIARDRGGLKELVEESGGGLLFRTPDELDDALASLATDAALRERLSRRAYRTFVERWTAEAHLERYLALLDRLARRKYGEIPWAR